MHERDWYTVQNADEYDSPVLLIYPDRVRENIKSLIEKINPERLRPHVKTNKIAEVCQMMMDAGITKFKAATIGEAEMLASIKAPDVLLAYQPVGPKINRLISLINKYPDTSFSCLTDNAENLQIVSSHFAEAALTARVYIDLNLGMNRTGIFPEQAFRFFQEINSYSFIEVIGLHAYDGHIRDHDFVERNLKCERAFLPVLELKKEIESSTGLVMTLIAGGTPTCFIHAAAGGRECSPGTFVFWDKGYSDLLPEQSFHWAAVLICRVISLPGSNLICTDLGYKSVASENPLPRVFFINAPNAIPVAHSEEHLVLRLDDSNAYKPGDILYAVPTHICPTVALYDFAHTVSAHRIDGVWKVARKR